jgi:SEFIR domain-containing protein
MLNQMFISYRNESPEHARAVRRLGELLRHARIPVMLDRFFLDENPGGPDLGGWPKWCEDCANQSQCVLIIASEGWFATYDKTAQPGSGLGAATEADLFRQTLWDDMGNNARIRLAFLHNVAAEKVPVRLRAWHQFRPFDADAQLDQLIRWLADCLGLQGIQPPTVRWPAPVEFEPDLADRNKKEWPAVVDLLAGHSRERILLLEGGSGLGKSELVRQAAAYAKKLGLPVARVDFRVGTLNTEAILGQLYLDLGDHLPNFSREGANKTFLLCKDLRALRQPVFLILDSYEDAADNKPVADWLNQQLLTEVENAFSLAVVVAGQRVPDLAKVGWRDLARHLRLEPIRLC